MRKLIYVYAIGMRRLNDRPLSFLGPFKFCFITALAATVYRRPSNQDLSDSRKSQEI